MPELCVYKYIFFSSEYLFIFLSSYQEKKQANEDQTSTMMRMIREMKELGNPPLKLRRDIFHAHIDFLLLLICFIAPLVPFLRAQKII
jgi:hypothetical protein